MFRSPTHRADPSDRGGPFPFRIVWSSLQAELAPMNDPTTLQHVIKLLEARLEAVHTYGAGGCPTCHDAELRGAIVSLRRLVQPATAQAATVGAGAPFTRRR
jgi:hypothetical protein